MRLPTGQIFSGDGAPTAAGESASARSGAARSRDSGIPVVTAMVGTDAVGPQIRAIGTVTAARAVTLYSEVTGIVRSVEVEQGARVGEGQVLVRLDDDDQVVAIDRAEIALDDARAALDRAERLAKTNNVTEVALSDARTAVRSAEIDLKSAEIERNKRIISAPFAGVVGLIPVDAGDLVNTSAPLTTLDDVSRFTVAFNATERFADIVKVGHPVTGTAVGLPGREIKGAVSAIDSRVDPATRVFEVEATLEEGIEGLKPGMSIIIAVDFAGEPQKTRAVAGRPVGPAGVVRVDARWRHGEADTGSDSRPQERHRHRCRRPRAGRPKSSSKACSACARARRSSGSAVSRRRRANSVSSGDNIQLAAEPTDVASVRGQ